VNSAGEIEGESTAGEGPLAMRSGFQAVAFMLIIRCHQQLMHSRSRRVSDYSEQYGNNNKSIFHY